MKNVLVVASVRNISSMDRTKACLSFRFEFESAVWAYSKFGLLISKCYNVNGCFLQVLL